MSTYRTNKKPRRRETGGKATSRGATHEYSGFTKLQRRVMKYLGTWQHFRPSSIAKRARQRHINELALAHGISLSDSLEALKGSAPAKDGLRRNKGDR